VRKSSSEPVSRKDQAGKQDMPRAKYIAMWNRCGMGAEMKCRQSHNKAGLIIAERSAMRDRRLVVSFISQVRAARPGHDGVICGVILREIQRR